MAFKVTKEWYEAAVKSALILNYGYSEAEAEKLIHGYGLEDCLKPDENGWNLYLNHYDPEDIADEIVKTINRHQSRSNSVALEG